MAAPVLVDLRERLEVMFEQENEAYSTRDYINPFLGIIPKLPPTNLSKIVTQGPSAFGLADDDTFGEKIKEHWREIICEWGYNLVDHFKLPRERVAVFMNLLDRYLAKYLDEHSEGLSKRHFQLLSLTCLYITIKMECHQGFLSMDVMIHLSREKFTKPQMILMEKEILHTLEWKVHPPTPFTFLQYFLMILPADQQLDHDTVEAARFHIELAVLDYRCIQQRASRIALAALLNAMEQRQTACSAADRAMLEKHFNFVNSLISPGEQDFFVSVRGRLMELYSHQVVSDPMDDVLEVADALQPQGSSAGPRVVSPVSVTRSVCYY